RMPPRYPTASNASAAATPTIHRTLMVMSTNSLSCRPDGRRCQPRPDRTSEKTRPEPTRRHCHTPIRPASQPAGPDRPPIGPSSEPAGADRTQAYFDGDAAGVVGAAAGADGAAGPPRLCGSVPVAVM